VTLDSRQRTATLLLLTTAAGTVVSAYLHFYLYFEGGYRGIAPEAVLGLTISRSFVLTAIAGVVLGELLVAGLLWPRLVLPAAIGAVVFSVGAIVAYVLARTSGLLGFTESQTITEAVLALIAETITVVTGSVLAILAWRTRSTGPDAGVDADAGVPASPAGSTT
jgi:hypothetical protein